MTDEQMRMTKPEADQVRRVAKMFGISEDEAAERILRATMQQMVKKRTGKNPAKVYEMPRKGGK